MIFAFLVETPSWLLSKGKLEKAERNFKILRGVPKNSEMPTVVSNEFEIMSKKYKIDNKDNHSNEKKSILKLFFRKGAIKPFIIMNLFFFFQQFSGIFVVIFYAVQIVVESGVSWDPYLITILIGICRLLVTVCMGYICKRYGRRPPSIVSGAGMTICMACLATYLFLSDTGQISEEWEGFVDWIPAVSLILFILTSTIGFLTLPWAMIGEVFPSDVRGFAAGLTVCFAYIFNFIIVKAYSDMRDALSSYGVFFFYGAFSVFGTIFVVLFLPETQGKTLLEIEEYFSRKKSKNDNPS